MTDPENEKMETDVLQNQTENIQVPDSKIKNFADDESESDPVIVEKIDLESFAPTDKFEKDNLKMDLLLNLALNVSIELGRTEMFIKDILKLGIGSIVELNKLAGEPVDVLVNNKKIAEGEVVVIDENFGVRITHLLNSSTEIEKITEAVSSKL